MTPIRLLALAMLVAATGCETVEGFGRDVEAAGEAITDEAQAAQ
jgi:predicted small secreted protein